MPDSILDQIIESIRQRLIIRKRTVAISDLQGQINEGGRDFVGALTAPGISVIAEIKRRSPSEGAIRPDADPAAIAKDYERAGAAGLSVLTEPEYFAGSTKDLLDAREACSLPVLQKDFLIDPYQIFEAKVLGADAVLLIMAALEDALYKDMYETAASVHMTALIEVHDESELDRALVAEPRIIGINQRSLKTFDVDSGLACRLRSRVPAETLVVAESGISSHAQMVDLERAAIDAVLVGTSLLRADQPGTALKQLIGAA